jgi:sarcosine oxidase
LTEHREAVQKEEVEGPEGINRRDFIRRVGVQTGALVAGASALSTLASCDGTGAPLIGTRAAEIVVIGAGAFGGWTALYLQEMGHRVTLVDAYGPGNSRATSGDETRGVRTGYGDKELWTRWASEAIRRWKQRDAEWGSHLFFTSGDLIMREDWDEFQTQTKAMWEKVGVRHEVLSHDELRYRHPQINADGINAVLYETDAGIGRCRMACLTVASHFERLGGKIEMARAEVGESSGGRLKNLRLHDGRVLGGDAFVFALGPWFPKVFPELMAKRMRIPMGHVFYYGTPVGDPRFTHPNIPSYNFPGVTGWATIPMDNRGFRVRIGGHMEDDPDTSVRWIDPQHHEMPRNVLRERFPAMADAPLVETRACHYELSSNRNFIVDNHPNFGNVWIAGGGNAEGFKFGPVIGEYIAQRVLGQNDDPELKEAFRLPEETYDSRTT